jgi:oligosaccharyltransferase complex subunit beta
MARLSIICIGLLLFVSVWSSTLNIEGSSKRLLVLLDNLGIRESHSFYFKQLKDRGFDITYKSSDDVNIQIVKYGEYLYDHIIIFAPATKEFGGRLDAEILTEFVDAGGNVLVAGSNTIGDSIREFASECGIEFADDKSAVIDHLNYDVNDNGQHTLVVASPNNLLSAELIVGQAKKNNLPFLFRGIGMSSDPDNPLLLDVLTASSTSYTANPDEQTLTEYPATVGKRTLLISVLQARNNARVGFVGSLDFFSNEFFESSVQPNNGKKQTKSGNQDLAVALSDWLFKQRGVLRARNIRHYLKSDKTTPRFYTVKDDIVFNVQFDEFVYGQWVPFNGTDVQLEFVRIDPFVRTKLNNNGGQLEAQFCVPDTYGIFKFVIDYNRVGYTHLQSATQVSVHPLRHTEYERFIASAYPYYISSFSMMVGAFLLSFIVLYHRDDLPKKKTE